MSHCSMSPNGDNPTQENEQLKELYIRAFYHAAERSLVAQKAIDAGIKTNTPEEQDRHIWREWLWRRVAGNAVIRAAKLIPVDTAPAGGAE